MLQDWDWWQENVLPLLVKKAFVVLFNFAMIAWHQVAIIVPNAFPCRNSPIKFALNTKYVGLNSRFIAISFWCYPFFRIQDSLDLESSLKKFQAIQIEHAKCHAKMRICPIGTATIFNSISYPLTIHFSLFKRFFSFSQVLRRFKPWRTPTPRNSLPFKGS